MNPKELNDYFEEFRIIEEESMVNIKILCDKIKKERRERVVSNYTLIIGNVTGKVRCA